MSIVVNTNIASMNAQRSLMASSNSLQEAMERLSTGKKINSAADDAAGFAIAESMTAQIRGLTMATKNASDALGLLRVVENATNDVTDMLQRIRSLAVQAQSDTNSSSDNNICNNEARKWVSSDTSYNNVAYLGTGAASSTKWDTTTATLFRLTQHYNRESRNRRYLQLTSHLAAIVDVNGNGTIRRRRYASQWLVLITMTTAKTDPAVTGTNLQV